MNTYWQNESIFLKVHLKESECVQKTFLHFGDVSSRSIFNTSAWEEGWTISYEQPTNTIDFNDLISESPYKVLSRKPKLQTCNVLSNIDRTSKIYHFTKKITSPFVVKESYEEGISLWFILKLNYGKFNMENNIQSRSK